LLCPQGTVVARFSAQGVTAKAIEREARMHYRERKPVRLIQGER
jgi:hypothetical protein